MAIKNTLLGGTDWVSPARVKPTDLNDTFDSTIDKMIDLDWIKIKGGYDSNIGTGLIKFSDLIWQTESARTTDGGANWTSGGYTSVSGEDMAAASGTNGIAVDNSDGSTAYTDDSGANWQASSTQPANITAGEVLDISGNQAVLGGQASSGVRVWYSSDGGDNWTQASTGPTESIRAISMYSSTVGYLTDFSTNLWKTTDGGANWTDTGDNSSGANNIIAVSEDVVYSTHLTSLIMYKYVNSTNTESIVLYLDGNGNGASTKIVKDSNGNVFFGFLYTNTSWTRPGTLWGIKYDGTEPYIKSIGLPKNLNPSGVFYVTGLIQKNISISVSNKIYLNLDDHIFEINL